MPAAAGIAHPLRHPRVQHRRHRGRRPADAREAVEGRTAGRMKQSAVDNIFDNNEFEGI
jgi:hypothetical protein